MPDLKAHRSRRVLDTRAKGQIEPDPHRFAAVFGLLQPVLRAQDAPRASDSISARLAMTRLARPNSENSCASFLARPL